VCRPDAAHGAPPEPPSHPSDTGLRSLLPLSCGDGRGSHGQWGTPVGCGIRSPQRRSPPYTSSAPLGSMECQQWAGSPFGGVLPTPNRPRTPRGWVANPVPGSTISRRLLEAGGEASSGDSSMVVFSGSDIPAHGVEPSQQTGNGRRREGGHDNGVTRTPHHPACGSWNGIHWGWGFSGQARRRCNRFPCLTPLRIPTVPTSRPQRNIIEDASVNVDVIYCCRYSGIPKFSSAGATEWWETESKAFLRSREARACRRRFVEL
jgi:hypothetical protein